MSLLAIFKEDFFRGPKFIEGGEKPMEPKKYQLFIDGKNYFTRGLDLACNPYNGNVLGDVVLIAETLLKEEIDENEDTVRLYREMS